MLISQWIPSNFIPSNNIAVKAQQYHRFVSISQPTFLVPQLNFQTELLWVGQVRGWSRIRLVPREPCDHYCPELLDDLMEGQMGECRSVLGHVRSHKLKWKGDIIVRKDHVWRVGWWLDKETRVNGGMCVGSCWEGDRKGKKEIISGEIRNQTRSARLMYVQT